MDTKYLVPNFERVEHTTIVSVPDNFDLDWAQTTNKTLTSETVTITIPAGFEVVTGVSMAAIALDGEDQFLEISPLENDTDSCLTNIENCAESGITFILRFKLAAYKEGAVIYSNGGEHVDGYGVALMCSGNKYQIIVQTMDKAWYVTVDTVAVGMWTELVWSWQLEYGLTVYKDGVFVTRNFEPVMREVVITTFLPIRTVIGCPSVEDVSTEFKFSQVLVEKVKVFFTTAEALINCRIINLGANIKQNS